MRRSSLVLALFVAVVGISASLALAGGGKDIASAPDLPLGQQVQGGEPDGCKQPEFWRVALSTGDRLRIDYGSLNGHTIVLSAFPPSMTDYTFDEEKYVATSGTSGKAELVYVAAGSGRYPLFLRTASCGVELSYELTGYVQRYTHATITGPTVVRARARVTLRGKITGLSSGKIAIQSRTRTGWKTLTLLSVKPDGSFVFKTRVGGTGTYRVRVVFYGDASHLPSSAVYSFKVV